MFHYDIFVGPGVEENPLLANLCLRYLYSISLLYLSSIWMHRSEPAEEKWRRTGESVGFEGEMGRVQLSLGYVRSGWDLRCGSTVPSTVCHPICSLYF